MNSEPKYFIPGEDGFKGQILDDFLSSGYYRMQHLVFTTHQTSLDYNSDSIPVFWLRTIINNITENKTALVIRKKCALFTVTIMTATVTEETEALYSLYRNNIDFSAAASCKEYLHLSEFENPYDSFMIEVRHGNILVAVGFFDKGKDSIAGILNFYHPDYKKYSLGKFLILQKIAYATLNEISFYYTGYISTDNSKFDYKIFPDMQAIEVYLPVENLWMPYKLWGKEKLKEYYEVHCGDRNTD